MPFVNHMTRLAAGLTLTAATMIFSASEASARVTIEEGPPLLDSARDGCMNSGRSFWYVPGGQSVIGGICASIEGQYEFVYARNGRLIYICDTDPDGLEMCQRMP